jgi:ABC-2 type transport system ATP-binding protein
LEQEIGLLNLNEVIKLEKVTKTYAGRDAVTALTFSALRGKILALLGINGAGKSTTLRMLAGILRPSNGSIRILGRDIVRDHCRVKREIGYIPDRPHLYPKLTCSEFLAFVGGLYRLENEVIGKRMEELLTEYALIDARNQLVESLSHGMKQRLSTCAALLHNPLVLLIDEPMVGLDPHGAKLFKSKLREYATNGVTTILSTHTLSVAEELADEFAIMHRGKLMVFGNLEKLREESDLPRANIEEIFLKISAVS